MIDTFKKEGFLNKDEISKYPGCPSHERLKKGPVAVIECTQKIPCNPCEAACPFGAINVGDPITNLPVLDEKKCKGCGLCIASCPGLAIFSVDYTYSDNKALVSFPYEYLPLPEVGDKVEAVNRKGEVITSGNIIKVDNKKSNDHTSIISIAIPKELFMEVRGIKNH